MARRVPDEIHDRRVDGDLIHHQTAAQERQQLDAQVEPFGNEKGVRRRERRIVGDVDAAQHDGEPAEDPERHALRLDPPPEPAPDRGEKGVATSGDQHGEPPEDRHAGKPDARDPEPDPPPATHPPTPRGLTHRTPDNWSPANHPRRGAR